MYWYVCLSDTSSESPFIAGQFHSCRSLASISETPRAGSKEPLLRQLSEPLGRVCTCPSSMHHVTNMEQTVTFVVPELSEKTIMNVSIPDVE